TNVGTSAITTKCGSVSGGRAKCSNYTLTNTSATLTVTKKAITGGAPTCSNKTYDGGTSASCTFGTYSGVISGDSVTITPTCTFADADASTSNKTVTCSYASNNNNYSAPANQTTTAKINAKSITVTWGTVSWTYDGSTHSTTATPSGTVSGETMTLSLSGNSVGKDVGSATVTASCGSVSGGRAKCSNYSVSATKTISITAKSVSVSWGTLSWTYDRNTHSTTASATGISGETINVSLSGNSVGAGVGSSSVTASCGSVTGGQAKCTNYSLTNTSKTISITAKSLTPTATCSEKTYDGGTSATCTKGFDGVVSGDTITASATCTFADADASTSNKTVTCSGYTKSGTNSDNYTLSSTSATATAKINAKSIAVSYGTLSWTYDGSAHSTTFSATTGVSGETMTVSLNTGTNSITNVGTSAITTKCGSVSGGRAKCSNYSLTNTSATLTVTAKQCATPTSVAVSTAGYVSWTNSATTACTTHQVKVASGSYATETSPVNKNTAIIESTGSRTVKVKAIAPNSNYTDSAEASASVTVYAITLASNDTNKGTVSPTSKNVISGATVTTSGNNLLIKGVTTGTTTTTLATITPTANAGYQFASWSKTSGSLTSAQTITGTFEGNIYTVSFDKQDGSGGTSTVYYRYNTTKTVDGVTCYYFTSSDLSDSSCLPNGDTITTPTKSGKSFAGYYTQTYGSGIQYINSSGVINSLYQKTPSEIDSSYTDTITLYAKWTYTVTYNENNTCSGTVSNLPSSQTAVENVNTTLSTTQPTCSGDEVFIGWFADNVWYDPGATYTAKNNITLYARWYNIKALEQQYTSFVEYGDFETDTVSKADYNAGGPGSTYVWTQAAETMSGYTNKGLSGFSYTDLYRPYWVVAGQGQVRQQEAGSGDLIQFYLYTKNRTSTSYSDSIQSRINRLKRLQDVTLTYDELKSKECVEDNKTLNGTYYQGTCEPDSTYQIIGYSGFNVTAATTDGAYYSRAYMGKIHKLTDSSYGFFQVGLAQNVTAKLKITAQYLEQKMKSASSSYSDPTTPAIGTSSKGYARGTALASLESGAENRFPASYLKVSSRLSGSSYTVSPWASATSSVNISVSSANKCKILGIAGHAANNDTGGSNMSYAVINRAQIGTINAAGTTSNVRYYGGNSSRSTSTGQTLTKVLGFTYVRYLCQGSISTS
ncbi:MAG: InlB B-repeat-containing protein, partial [Bacilli bacterium]|nr:InlB B-repeat-containing protein [Bacilli bacterium]